jgi:Hypothetical protein (DUF2513)
MKRDDEFMRALLFEAELSIDSGVWKEVSCDDTDIDVLRRNLHIDWLADANLLVSNNDEFFRITNQGHDFLAAIRDDTIWKKTTAGAKAVGGVTLPILKDLAVAYLKQEIEQRLGVQL